MKRIAVVFLMVLSFLFVACAPIGDAFNPFEYNAFSEVEETPGDQLNEQLETFDPDTATEEEVKEVVTGFIAAAEDDNFIDNLEANEEKKTTVTDTLEQVLGVSEDETGEVVVTVPTVFATQEDRSDYQDAALTLAIIETATTGGDEFVTNLGGLLETFMGSSDTDPDDPDNPDEGGGFEPEAIIASLVPDSMLVSEPVYNEQTGQTEEVFSIPTDDPVVKDNFIDMVEGLISADLALNALGQTLDEEPVINPDTGLQEIDPETGLGLTVPVFENDETVAADVAQTAVVASIVGSLADSVSGDIPVDTNGDQLVAPAEVIFALAADDPDDPNDGIVIEEGIVTMTTADGGTVDVPVDLNEFDPFGALDPESDSGTASIVAASGLDALLAGLFGGDEETDPEAVE